MQVIRTPTIKRSPPVRNQFLPHEAGLPVFVNADLIAAGLSPFNPEAAAFRAGRLMLEEIAAHTAAGRSFALESTLSGLAYVRTRRLFTMVR
jgi:predicted ABC-type ATPase